VYRYQVHILVRSARWRDVTAVLDQLDVAMQARNLVPFQVWEAAFGRFNDALLIAEYDSLASYEREHDALHADPTCMRLWRELGEHLTEAPWTDLWWTPATAR